MTVVNTSCRPDSVPGIKVIAGLCKPSYSTRVWKACFIADSLSVERLGRKVLGLNYAHADHGPVVDGYKDIEQALEVTGQISLEKTAYGSLVIAKSPISATYYSADERQCLVDAADYVNSFITVGELSAATHLISSWMKTENGDQIDFCRTGEVESMVEERLYDYNDETKKALDEGLAGCGGGQLFSNVDDMLTATR